MPSGKVGRKEGSTNPTFHGAEGSDKSRLRRAGVVSDSPTKGRFATPKSWQLWQTLVLNRRGKLGSKSIHFTLE